MSLITDPTDTGEALILSAYGVVCGQRLLDVTGFVARASACVLPLDRAEPKCPTHGHRELPE
jgi:hypothetical protein